MLVDKTDVQIESTVTGNRVAMTLDEDLHVHIMGILKNQYSDPEGAIVREYSTNAWDSHIEAGILRPIEVTLPTEQAPFLTIQDYGIGLDRDGIERIYSKYGASTKRESNDFNGQLGIGGKSALAYTAQFTIVGVKDGIRTQVLVTDGDDGGSMTVVSAEPTDLPNGVTVEIPVKLHNRIEQKARAFFRFWSPGTVLINGREPDHIEGMNITNDLVMIPEEHQDWLVMGNVAYPVNFDHELSGYNVVAYVPIGDVAFAPSREALNYDKKVTKDTLAALEATIIESIPEAVQRTVNEAPTAMDAMRCANTWREALGRRFRGISFTYKKSEIPSTFAAPENKKTKDGFTDNRFVVSHSRSSKLSQSTKYSSVAASWIASGMLVYGYDLTFTPSHKKKLNKYAEEQGIPVEHFVMCPIKPKHLRWVDKNRIVNWEVIRAIKLETHWNRPTMTGRIPGSYDLIVNGNRKSNVPGNDVPTNGNLFVRAINGNTFPKDYEHLADHLLNKHFKDCTVATIPVNRVDKFKRTFPMARDARTAIMEVYNRFKSAVTKDDLLAKAINDDYYGRISLQEIDPDKVKDPEIKKAVGLLKHGTTATDRLQEFRNLVYLKDRITVPKWNSPLEDYPLWDKNQMRNEPDHMYAYLNVAYPLVKQARKEAKAEARKAKLAERQKNRRTK